MKNRKLILGSFSFLLMIGLSSCKKSEDTVSDYKEDVTAKKVLADFVTYVATPQYADFEAKALALKTSVEALNASTTVANLTEAQSKWFSVREVWEKSEAWLIGPVSDNELDPKIDTWPMDTVQLNAVMNGTNKLNVSFVTAAEDNIRGFHPLEYVLFGKNKSKDVSKFTLSQKEYMVSLATVLYNNVQTLNSLFNSSYAANFSNVGVSGYTFTSEHNALTTLLSAMAGICDEVANEKMQTPITEYQVNGLEPDLFEESQYALSSLQDFRNNIVGVKGLYFGYYVETNKGYSLRDLVRKGAGVTVDNNIQTKIEAILAAFDALGSNVSYGEAVKTKLTQVQNIQLLINQLKDMLETDVLANYIDKNYSK